jgi:membrane carboxypeptidase/penicillin-binding protein PbpC
LSSQVVDSYQRILLQARATNATERLFWFLNGQMVHSGQPQDRTFIDPEPGRHRLVVSDDEGRSSAVEFVVVAENAVDT